MLTRLRPRFVILPVITCLVVPVSVAQVRVELGPALAYYRPLGSFDPTTASSVTLPARPGDMASAALGAQGRLWLDRRFGLELAVARASSSVPRTIPPGGPVGPTPVRVSTAAVQGVYAVASGERPRVWIAAGAGVVRHGGAAYAPYDSPTDLAGTFGLGSSFRIHGSLRATLGIITFLYPFEVTSHAGPVLQRGFQVDPLVQAALTWSWR